jgi:hypothetical protein
MIGNRAPEVFVGPFASAPTVRTGSKAVVPSTDASKVSP